MWLSSLGDFLTVGAYFYFAHSEKKRDDMQGMPTSAESFDG